MLTASAASTRAARAFKSAHLCTSPAARRTPNANAKWAAMLETSFKHRRPSKAHKYSSEEPNLQILRLVPGAPKRKIKGLGAAIDVHATFAHLDFGQGHETVEHADTQKSFVRLPVRLPELCSGMKRRAQIISPKDAGVVVARLGIGRDDRVLEAGLGSAGLAMHVSRCLGPNGLHVTVEPREEHATVGLDNLQRAQQSWFDGPSHAHVHGRVEESLDAIRAHATLFDAIVLDLPEHATAIEAVAPLLDVGGRLACYCPVTSQVESAWDACDAAGLDVEWAGELMERRWGRASRGGIRPVNGSFGHTAFLLIAQRRRVGAVDVGRHSSAQQQKQRGRQEHESEPEHSRARPSVLTMEGALHAWRAWWK